jgi:tetratricopeptide (TPR) repeat protein
MKPTKRVSRSAVLVWSVFVVVTLRPWQEGGVAATPLGRDEPRQASPAAPEKASRDWKRLQSPNFSVVGNASREEIQRTGAELEAFRAMLLQMFPTLRLSSPVPTEVVVFEDHQSFSPFKPRDGRGRRQEWVGGYFMPLADINYLVVAGQDGEMDLSVAFHEYTHYVLERNVKTMPIWLGEGISDFYSTFRPAPQEGSSVVGAAPPYRGTVLRNGTLIPLAKLLSTEGALKILQGGADREVAMFYAESWGLVHYLYLGQKGARGRQVGAYVEALQRGLTPAQAFGQAFQCSLEQMESELRQYLHAVQLPAVSIRRPANPGIEGAAAEPMLQAYADALQADLLTRVGADEDAEKAANRALAVRPEHPSAQLSLAAVRLKRDQRDEAISRLRGLTDKAGVGFAAQLALASALMEAGRYEEALPLAERAAGTNGQSPAAWFTLSLTCLALGRDAASEDAMQRVLQLDARPDYYRERAYSAFRLGQNAAVVRDATTFLERAGWGNESAPYVAFLGALAHRRVGQNAEADSMLRLARAAVQRGSWTEKVLSYMQRSLTADELLTRAKDNGEKTEAHAYIGFDLVDAGKRQEAIAHLTWVKDRGERNYVEYPMATAELRRLGSASGSTR